MSMLLAGLLLGLSACGNSAATNGQDSPAPQEAVTEAQETETPEQEEEETAVETAETEEPEQAAQQGSTEQESAAADNDTTAAAASADEGGAPKSNALAIYFSRVGNTDFGFS